MTILIAGMAVFIGIHLVPDVPALRARLVAKLGAAPYRATIALIALAGLVLIVYGKASAEHVALWRPPFPHALAAVLVLLGFLVAPATALPSNIRRVTRHPLLWGVTLWAAGHLAVNGDMASLTLFGGFATFALAKMVTLNRRGAVLSTARQPLRADVIVVLVGAAAYAVLVMVHPYLTGVPAVAGGVP